MRSLLLLVLCAAAAPAAPVAEKPRLVVLLAIDQMRPDTLRRYAESYTGGLARILARGRHFRGVLDHACTQTGPGHAAMLTGCHPSHNGIVANAWLDRTTLAPVYCVEDAAAPVYGGTSGRSPKLLRTSALGDWMRRADRRTRVYSLSAKDRAAILMGGQRPDGVFWLDPRAGGFTTSRYYYTGDGRPGWLEAFNGDGWLERLPATWSYEASPDARADDFAGESDRYGRTSPHPLRDDDRVATLRRVYASPFVDEWTLRLAAHLVERFDLGGDEVPDLLCVSLSATDTVGHLYGPLSQEIRDNTLRLDRHLGAFLDLLDSRGAPYVVAVTADHGVLPMPGMRRVDAKAVDQAVTRALQETFGTGDLYVVFAGTQVWLKPKAGVDAAEVRSALADALRGQDCIAEVLDLAKLEGTGPLVELVRHCVDAERCGDLYFVPKESVLLTTYGGTGTSHGSPYAYDREVPITFLGPGCGIEPGDAGRAARTVDIAPTLACLLGVPVPVPVDGSVLPLR